MRTIEPGTMIVQKAATVNGKLERGHWVGLITEIADDSYGAPERVMIEWIDTETSPDYNHQCGISFTNLHNGYNKFDLFPVG